MSDEKSKLKILNNFRIILPVFLSAVIATIVLLNNLIVGAIVTIILGAGLIYYVIASRKIMHEMDQKYFAEQQAWASRASAGARPVVCVIVVDDYIEVMNMASDTEISEITAAITKCVSDMAEELNGAYRRYDRDKYVIFFDRRRLQDLERSKFPILDKVHGIFVGNGQYITLSIAVGAGEDAKQSNDFAKQATEVVLGRGGDQAAVKTEQRTTFYGGLTQNTQKRSKVKPRVTARALRAAIEKSSEVFVMGHARPDMDSIGAAMGILRCAQFSEKCSRIVLDSDIFMVEPFIKRLKEEGLRDIIVIDAQEAQRVMRSDALVVLVDTQRPSSASCPKLLEITDNIVVIDHHRRGLEWVENATVSFLEPYASSASELVTEILQYYDPNIRLTELEAEALLSGIAMDTKHFFIDTGARTFEAATYLRKQGADMVRVRDLLADDYTTFSQRMETIKNVKLFRDDIAIAYFDRTTPRGQLVASQAADQLLTIRGIKAAIVLVPVDNAVQVSARSTGEINVQLIMEEMGGGGHLAMAATQLKEYSIEQALKEVEETLSKL